MIRSQLSADIEHAQRRAAIAEREAGEKRREVRLAIRSLPRNVLEAELRRRRVPSGQREGR